jgi:hypothetical protein
VNAFAAYRDYIAGCLIAGIGAFAVVEGQSYGMGSLQKMGSGFFPVMLGAGMILMGVLMALFAQKPIENAGSHHGMSTPDWRAAAGIAVGVALFMALANRAGLAPAIFACVFTASLGNRRTTLKEAFLLGLGVMVFGVLLFAYGLKVPFPVLTGVLN